MLPKNELFALPFRKCMAAISYGILNLASFAPFNPAFPNYNKERFNEESEAYLRRGRTGSNGCR